MPLLYATLPEHFTISIFGAQYHGEAPSAEKQQHIDNFVGLLSAAKYFDDVIHDDNERGLGISRVWISYWLSPEAFAKWWTSEEVVAFWGALPEDVGFWRETMHFPTTRFLNEVSQEIPSGVSHLGPIVPITEKTCYWGAYRDRILESTKEDRLASPLATVPEPRKADGTIRQGRVRMAEFPENLCYVIEGQDHTPLKEDETRVWSSKFHWLAKRWVTNIMRAGPEGGVLSARMMYAPENGRMKVEPSDLSDDPDILPQLEMNRKIELLYFLDMSYMERAGRKDKVHVDLRDDFIKTYGPGGIMSHGDLLMWVELGILKSQSIEAEYIGCYEGTGFLAYDHHPEFKSNKDQPGGKGFISGVLKYLGM